MMLESIHLGYPPNYSHSKLLYKTDTHPSQVMWRRKKWRVIINMKI